MSGSSNAPVLTAFTSGDLVVSVVGDGDGSGTYGDNQAAPIVLEELTATGVEVGQETLPQTTTVSNGITESPISGEYGSSSEGSLELAANGESLVIAGYGINDTTFNEGEENGNNVYGNVALAQSTSLTDQTTYTPVTRVIADIGYNNAIDTSTALYNVFNTNNPRSVATINGQTFYIAGQGVKGDTTEGVFVAQDGASSATAIDTSSDSRTVEIYDGKLYVSRDSTQAGGGGIGSYGATLPTGATAPTTLPGIAATVTLTAAQENSVNSGAVGQSVELSPENYFFANPTTLYVADGGQPKEGGIGDGGLQKWVLNTSTGVWTLAYTLSAGLNLIENSSADPANTAGTTGLIGLTGVVNANGTVTFYATNSTIGDLDQTYVYTITDTIGATSPAAHESFTVIDTAAPDTNVRGIAFAPAATGVNTTIAAGQTTATGLIISTGDSLTVSAGGAAVAVVVNSGGTAVISGTDSNSLIQALGMETVTGKATGDQVWGTQLVSGSSASASNETVEYGGVIDVYAGATATSTTVETSGGLYLGGGGTADNVVINGGSIVLQTALDTLGGLVTFNGPGEIIREAVGAAGTGITGAILNFGTSDVIDDTFIGAGAALTSSYSNGITNVTLTSGTGQNMVSDQFSFVGQYSAGSFVETYVAGSGTELTIKAATVANNTTSTVSAGYTQPDITVLSGGKLVVSAGGTITSASIQSKGSASVAGTDSGTTIAAGGSETISGAGSEATGDQIFGTQTVKSGTVINETVYSGGSLILDGKATADLVISGGSAVISTSSDTIGGSVTFAGAGEILISAAPANAADGLTAVVSGFAAGDVINAAFVGANTALTSVTSGGNTVVTISGSTGSQSVTFAGTYVPGFFQLSGTDIFAGPPTTVISSGQSTTPNFVVSSGTVLDVLHGGTATNVTIANGGSANFAGTDTGTTISLGGSATVSATGVQTSATVQEAGNELVLGAASGNTIASTGIVSIGAGGTDTNTDIQTGGYEVMLGSATGDQVSGVQLVSAGTAVVNNETVFNGGMIDLYLKGAIASNTILETGGSLNISGNATAEDTVIQGGSLILQSPKALLADGITFAGAGTIALTVLTTTSAGTYGDQAVISGFGAGDVIDVTSIGTGASLSNSTSGGNTVETITSGSVTETFIFAGSLSSASFTLSSDGGTGVELTSRVTTLTISNGQTTPPDYVVSGGFTLEVLAGGTASGVTILNGGVANIAGTDTSATIAAGGAETVFGAGIATGDIVYGAQSVTNGGTVSGETVGAGGVVTLDGAAAAANMQIAGGTLVMETSTDTLDHTVTFSGAGEIVRDAVGMAGTGITGAILGFAVGDIIDDTFIGQGAVLTSMTSNGITDITLTSGTGQNQVSDEFSFSGNYTGDTFVASYVAGSGTELTVNVAADTTVISSGQSTPPNYVVMGGQTLDIRPGGSATGVTIDAGGSANFAGTDIGTVIDGGGNATVTGSESGATVMADDDETIADPGSATDDQIYGNQIVSSGGSVTGETVYNGGVLTVLAGGSATSTTISSGGAASFAGTDTGTVISGGSATVTGAQTSATVLAAGGETIAAAGSATGDKVYGSQTIANGGSATSETVENGGLLTVQGGGSATSTTVSAGGSATISGTETSATVLAAGSETILGSATGGQIYGVQLVSAATAAVSNETVFNGGSVDLFLAGVTASNTVLSNGGTLNISGNATDDNTVIQGGTIVLESPKATLADGVTFGGSGVIFVTSKVSSVGYGDKAVISGFGANDFIEVASSGLIGSGAGLVFTPADGGTETSVTVSGHSGAETFIFNGAVSSANLQMVTSGGYEVIEAACFCAGTNIRTPDGDAPVETLKIGDMVMTAGGQAVPVRWVGIHTVSTRFADPLRVMPVRIRAGALGENLPERDLLLSPDHAMFLGGILLQAGALVNGGSITREARMPEIFTYYHVELADHELILAEGAPAETFVDNVDRMAFDNWAEHEALYGSEAEIVEMPYPRVKSARQLPTAMRRLLAARAAAICGNALAG